MSNLYEGGFWDQYLTERGFILKKGITWWQRDVFILYLSAYCGSIEYEWSIMKGADKMIYMTGHAGMIHRGSEKCEEQLEDLFAIIGAIIDPGNAPLLMAIPGTDMITEALLGAESDD